MSGWNPSGPISRRAFHQGVAAGVAGMALSPRLSAAPAFIQGDAGRPTIDQGVASGEVTGSSAVIWSRTDRPARMMVEYATTESFQNARRVAGPTVLPQSDYTGRVILNDLPAGETIVYRVWFQDLTARRARSAESLGRFRTAPVERSDIRFAWGGDVAGQGWGIDPTRGGMRAFEAMSRWGPHFFIHSGDAIYADNPIVAEVPLDDGSTWRNLVTEAKSKVAESIAEFRGNYLYNLLDDHYRRFQSEVPWIAQWDDHETTNNWYPGEILDDPRYTVKNVDLLAARARQAFFEYMPIRYHPDDQERLYRSVRYGPHLEVFVLDERSYRGPNSTNRQETPSAASAFLGPDQTRWLRRALLASDATWKVIASDMPLGLIVGDGPDVYEAVANGNGPALGRELEIAGLLAFLQAAEIRNVVWLTADVHYAAAHYYDPAQARFHDFHPFWEFVAGPLHAGTFGPGRLDDTFGPQAKFVGIPSDMKPNRPPSEGFQFFGGVRIEGRTGVMTVSLHNPRGETLYEIELPPEA